MNLDEFLLQDKSELTKDMTDSPSSPAIETLGQNRNQVKKSNYLKELNKAADWNEEQEFALIQTDPRKSSEIKRKVLSEGSSYSDNLLEYFSQSYLITVKKARYASLISSAVENCTEEVKVQIFKSVVGEWITFCTHKNATKVAQSLISTCSEFLIDEMFYATLENLYDQVKDMYGYYCTAKLVKRLKPFQLEEVFNHLLYKPFFWKTKNCFLTMCAIVNSGISDTAMEKFNEVADKIDEKGNRNVSRLRKLIRKKMDQSKTEKFNKRQV